MKTAVSIALVFIVLIAGAWYLGRRNGEDISKVPVAAESNVSVADGKQVIAITAKGGFAPRTSTAKADMPTVLKVTTRGTFDCSSALVIPSINYRGNLPPSGETLIEIPPQKPGTTLQGVCSMGMYSFAVNFK